MKAKRLVLVGLVAAGLFGGGVAMADGGFGATCRNVRLEYPLGPYGTKVELCAECGDGKGGWIDNCGDAAIHLDWVVGNNNGELAPGRGFQNTCGSCGVFEREASEWFPLGLWPGCNGKTCFLACGPDGKNHDGYGCRKPDGKWSGSIFGMLNLNRCVVNNGGHLAWGC